MGRLGTISHLAARFFGSLSPRPLDPDDDRWARQQLTDGETRLWRRMCRADRKHAVGVARRVEHALGDDATRPVLAAALLHDVGKIDSGLGTLGRVGATLVGTVASADRTRHWQRRAGPLGRVGRYLHHDRRGAHLLRAAGADDLTVDWARDHHRPEERWAVPARIGRALRDADDD